MLAYGSCVAQYGEVTRMGESTTLKFLKKWCSEVVHHSKIVTYGAQYDINVFYQLDIFDSNLEGISPQVTYKVNGSTYNNTYYLAEGIYSRYPSFVKTILNPQSDAEKLFMSHAAKMLRRALVFYNVVGQ
ncbi:hypothetical protein QQ045_000460 [Rhodiola kirilowii]